MRLKQLWSLLYSGVHVRRLLLKRIKLNLKVPVHKVKFGNNCSEHSCVYLPRKARVSKTDLFLHHLTSARNVRLHIRRSKTNLTHRFPVAFGLTIICDCRYRGGGSKLACLDSHRLPITSYPLFPSPPSSSPFCITCPQLKPWKWYTLKITSPSTSFGQAKQTALPGHSWGHSAGTIMGKRSG